MTTPAKEPVKKAVRITADAHELLKDYCDRTGRTQVDVLSELMHRFVKPKLEDLEGSAKR